MSGFGKKLLCFVILLLVAFIIFWMLFQVSMNKSPIIQKNPPAKPNIISRATWNARPINLEAPEEYGIFDARMNPVGVLTYSDDLQSDLYTIVIHHSAFPSTGPTEIQNLHMDGRGFTVVAYHFMVDSEGLIYEGREINIRGAHVKGYNTGFVGIVLLGNFNTEQPPKAQLTSLRMLVDYLRYTNEIPYLASHKIIPTKARMGRNALVQTCIHFLWV